MSEFLVSPEWLQQRLGTPGLKIVDASWFLPAQQRDSKAEFLAGHIPGAVYFDIDAIADRSTDLPHMLPSEEDFAAAAGRLGLSGDDTIIVYDSLGLFSAPRVWWTLKVFGARDVRILDGGLPAWKRAGLPLESGDARPEPAEFEAKRDERMVRNLQGVRDALATGEAVVVDARSAARFRGDAPEPRPGLRSGHMPGSRNLPYDTLVGADGKLLPPASIRKVLAEAELDTRHPVVTTCGSGVTAALLAFAFATIGKTDVGVYDGSWAEWAAQPNAEIVTGSA